MEGNCDEALACCRSLLGKQSALFLSVSLGVSTTDLKFAYIISGNQTISFQKLKSMLKKKDVLFWNKIL